MYTVYHTNYRSPQIHSFGTRYPIILSLLIWAGFLQAQSAPEAPSGLSATAVSSTVVEIEWIDNSDNETGFSVERSLSEDSGFEAFAILTADATYLRNFRLSPGTTYYYRVLALNEDGTSNYTSVGSATTNVNEAELPYYWTKAELGSVDFDHQATFEDGFYFTEGQGFFGGSDNGQIIYQTLQGDGEIVAELLLSRRNGNNFNGLTVREDLTNSSKYAAIEVNSSNATTQIGYRWREVAGESGRDAVTDDGTRYRYPITLKLERSGNEFIGSFAKEEGEWEEFHRETVDISENALIGLHNYSNRDADRNKRINDAEWRDIYVTQSTEQLPPPTNLVVQAGLQDEIVLSWDDNADNETSYRIERALKADTIIFRDLVEVGPNVTSYTEDGLTLGETYFYRVRAINENGASKASNEEKGELLEVPNTILLMQRLMDDEDRTGLNNMITVTSTPDTINNILRHPGMIGKQIDIELETNLSSTSGTLSLKVMPNTSQQTVTFFESDFISITQEQLGLSINVHGIERSYDVVLDSVTCNHVLLRFNGGVLEPYVNGTWFDEVAVGTFGLSRFTLNEFNGKLWEIQLVEVPISDETVHSLSDRCTNAVEPLELPFGNFPFRHCGVYTCLWLRNEEQLQEERKRAYLVAQDMSYDKNVFDVGMYVQPDLQDWVNLDRDIQSLGFDYYNLNNIFTRNQSNTSFWLHENFHGYQVPLLRGGKWLAEASADWATWNYFREPIKGMSRFTLNPHMGLFEEFPPNSGAFAVVRYYHASVLLAYITSFLTDESFIGTLYNTPVVEQNPISAMRELFGPEGIDFTDEFAEFAIRTSAWDYPDTTISDAFERMERGGINAGEADLRIAEVFDEKGTYGVFRNPPEALKPGPFGWNTYRIDSTAASTYTIRFKGDPDNIEETTFSIKIAIGTGKGQYEYFDLPVSEEATFGDEEVQIEIDAEAGETLFWTVLPTPIEEIFDKVNFNFDYEYAIESSEHILPEDHIRRFQLAEETGPAMIDHDELTVEIEVVRGTDASQLIPDVTLSPGATSEPANGETVDFTEPVIYQVTGADGVSSKAWEVNVKVVPLRSGTEILTFELQDVNRLATIDDFTDTIRVNLVSPVDLSSVVPIFTLSDGATSQPASGEAIDLTNPFTYTITAEDGVTTQEWTVSAENFRPFITTWESTTNNQEISVNLNESYEYDFEYVMKNAAGEEVTSGNVVSINDGGTFALTLPTPGTYTVEIKGAFPQFNNATLSFLKDVNQWGDVIWESMTNAFRGWDGETFTASDTPYLRNVTSMFSMFNNAKSFNGDLSQWDVRTISSMSEMFRGARAFNSDISNWDVRSLTGMSEMFREARAFNADISGWDVRNVTNMFRAFFGTTAFDQDLGQWDVSNTTSMNEMLRGAGLSTTNYDRTLIGWAAQDVRSGVVLGAQQLSYCIGEEARDFLVNLKEWVITDEGKDCVSGGTAIIDFDFDGRVDFPDYNDTDFTMTVPIDASMDVASVTPTILLSFGATSDPASGQTMDFTSPVTYTVTSEDGAVSQDWVVTLVQVIEEEEEVEEDDDEPNLNDELDQVQIQNVLTLNGDGINEEWIIEPFPGLNESEVMVFNKLGIVVFSSTGYSTPWDGSYNGNLLPEGVYYYVISGSSVELSGYILLTR